jgi:hypothetical protein
MPFPQPQVEWMIANRARILRYVFLPQLIVAVIFLTFAYFTGKTEVHLLLNGAHTRGKIVGFQRRELHTYRNPSSTGRYGRIVYLPIVEFEAQGNVARFEERKLVSQGEGVGWPVAVLYDPGNVSLAMIDRPFWNWIPWAPALLIGLFLALVAVKGLFSLVLPQRVPCLGNPTQTN